MQPSDKPSKTTLPSPPGVFERVPEQRIVWRGSVTDLVTDISGLLTKEQVRKPLVKLINDLARYDGE